MIKVGGYFRDFSQDSEESNPIGRQGVRKTNCFLFACSRVPFFFFFTVLHIFSTKDSNLNPGKDLGELHHLIPPSNPEVFHVYWLSLTELKNTK